MSPHTDIFVTPVNISAAGVTSTLFEEHIWQCWSRFRAFPSAFKHFGVFPGNTFQTILTFSLWTYERQMSRHRQFYVDAFGRFGRFCHVTSSRCEQTIPRCEQRMQYFSHMHSARNHMVLRKQNLCFKNRGRWILSIDIWSKPAGLSGLTLYNSVSQHQHATSPCNVAM